MRAAAVATFASALLAGCASDDALYSARLLAMGTWVDVTLDVEDPAVGEHVVRDVETFLRAFERDYYAWADGELARLNRGLERGESVHVDAALAALLGAAQQYGAASRGAFEPAVGGLVELWGFHTGNGDAVPPSDEAIAAWLARDVGIANLAIDADGTVRLARGQAGTLDLGGIAKGEAVDRIIAMLRSERIESALVNAGGDLRVLGAKRDRAWRVGIQAPRGSGVLGIVELADGEAAFTSGDYERFYEREGRRMHHILDPSTGYPVAHTRAVTVIANDGVRADAAATALVVAGPEHWRDVAAALGVAHVLRVGAAGEIEMTDAMRDRLQTDAVPSSDIIVRGN